MGASWVPAGPLNLDWGSKSHRHLDIPTPPDILTPSVLPQPSIEAQDKAGDPFFGARIKFDLYKVKPCTQNIITSVYYHKLRTKLVPPLLGPRIKVEL